MVSHERNSNVRLCKVWRVFNMWFSRLVNFKEFEGFSVEVFEENRILRRFRVLFAAQLFKFVNFWVFLRNSWCQIWRSFQSKGWILFRKRPSRLVPSDLAYFLIKMFWNHRKTHLCPNSLELRPSKSPEIHFQLSPNETKFSHPQFFL